MDPNHVQNFCANAFSLTGRQIDQLRQLLSSGAAEGTTTTITDAATPATPMAPQLMMLMLFMVMAVMMFMDRNRVGGTQSGETDPGLQKPHRGPNDDDNHRGGDGGDDMAT